MNQGFIVLHRQILEWEWYADSNVRSVFIHFLLKANHIEKQWQGQTINRGQFITSNEKLSIELNMSIQCVRTSIQKLIKTNEVTYKSTNRYTVITVVNYDYYQSNQQTNNKQQTSNKQTNNKQTTTTNNENNENNVNNEKQTIPTWDEFSAYAIEKKKNVCKDALKLKYEAWKVAGWKKQSNGNEVNIKNWKTTLLNTLPHLKENSIGGEEHKRLTF